MSEFVSKLEELMPAVELDFEPTPAFGLYKKYLEHAVAHPAKANTRLLEFLILNFTKPGETILDPMAGSGSTGVVAALHGRNAIQIDIEEKFYRWMEMAREKVEKTPTLTVKGKIVNICGDARRLSEILSQADTIITSPPYLSDNVKENSEEFWRRGKELGLRWGSKPPAGTDEKQYLAEGNIGNLPYVDTIITSPPYDNAVHCRGHSEYQERLTVDKSLYMDEYGASRDNIGNLKSSDEEYEALVKRLMTKSGKPTYLSEMLKVYSEMYRVLKPSGLAIIIVKPFQRHFKIVDLPFHTYLLMQRVGFRLIKLYKLRLKQASFWRILIYKKHPELPRINHEYVLVCQKP